MGSLTVFQNFDFLLSKFAFNRGFLSNFRKLKHAHAEHTRKQFYRTLSIRGTDFIAHWAYEERIFAYAQTAVKCEQFLHVNPCWAYAERISSHTEHTGNEFQRWLSTRGMDFIAGWAYADMFKSRSRISRPNRIHACVPLKDNYRQTYDDKFSERGVKRCW